MLFHVKQIAGIIKKDFFRILIVLKKSFLVVGLTIAQHGHRLSSQSAASRLVDRPVCWNPLHVRNGLLGVCDRFLVQLLVQDALGHDFRQFL